MAVITLGDLLKEYQVSIEKAKPALKARGIYLTNEALEVVDDHLRICREVLSELSDQDRNVPKKVMHTPNQPNANTHPKPQIVKSHKVGAKPSVNYQMLRDYMLLTQSAMRKRGFSTLMNTFFHLKNQENKSTMLVFLKTCLDSVRRAAEEDTVLFTNVRLIEEIIGHRQAIVLDAGLADEDQVLSHFLKQHYETRSMLVIGSSGALSTRIQYMNSQLKRNGKSLRIYEYDIDQDGKLKSTFYKKPEFQPFTTQRKTSNLHKHIENISIPEQGELVYDLKGNSVRLGELIHQGGAEGSIYSFPLEGKCAKIFNANSATPMKADKTLLMCKHFKNLREQNPVIMDRIAWPEKPLYNAQKQLIGYIMRYFKNVIPFSHYNNDSFPKLIPGVRKEHQIRMAKSFAELLVFMHANEVVLCDINRNNLLFDSRQQAYLVDLDSAQVSDKECCYLSNVGKNEYLSPEHIQDGNQYMFIHKKADDVWILQTLLFSMLTPDAKPYLTIGSDTEEMAVAKGDYPFQAGERTAGDLAGGSSGRWHIIISHFPLFLKVAFWESFHHNGKFFHEENRLTADDWLEHIQHYETCLPDMVRADEQSGWYEPTEHKKYQQQNRFSNKKMDTFSLIAQAEEQMRRQNHKKGGN